MRKFISSVCDIISRVFEFVLNFEVRERVMDCGIFWAICFAFALGLYLVALLIGACGLVIIADLLALICMIGVGLSVLGLIGMFLSILIGIVKLVSLVVKGICTAIYNAAIWLIAFITSFVSE